VNSVVIYKKLQEDREQADISHIIHELHRILDRVIIPSTEPGEDKDKLYDISKIDFERLKQEFGNHQEKRTLTQSLKEAVERRLQKMIAQNPLRVDFYKRYQEIIADYNREKDRATIEATFVALLKLMGDLDEEEKRHIREELSEEHLALFDILVQGKELKPREREAIKRVAKELLESLKQSKLRIDRWWEKEVTKSAIRADIHDFLYDEVRGLPTEAYTIHEVEVKTEFVFDHIYHTFPSTQQFRYAA
jgi:type I restriction enzyme, R subunit